MAENTSKWRVSTEMLYMFGIIFCLTFLTLTAIIMKPAQLWTTLLFSGGIMVAVLIGCMFVVKGQQMKVQNQMTHMQKEKEQHTKMHVRCATSAEAKHTGYIFSVSANQQQQ